MVQCSGYPHRCACGFYGDSTRERRRTRAIIQRYPGKIGGPLLDRIDIHVEAPTVPYKELRGDSSAESSAEIRARVERAHDRILKAARTVADLAESPNVAAKHVAEAAQYRSLDRNYWS
jgi:magnesium chelatase family protein